MTKFMGFSIQAIMGWDAIRNGEVFDPAEVTEFQQCALDEGLVAVVNGSTYLAPDGSGACGNPKSWAMNLRAALAGATMIPIRSAEETTHREFGSATSTICAGEIHAGPMNMPRTMEITGVTVTPNDNLTVSVTASPREPELEEESVIQPAPPVIEEATTPSVDTTAPASESDEDAPVAPKKLDDELRAKVSALPSYYASLKEPFNKLIDLGCDLVVIDTALELAGKPYHLGQIATYAKHISANLGENRDLMTVVQNAHRAASKLDNISEANDKILHKIMALIPEGRKAAWKARFEQDIETGKDKYWAEAWGQVEAAVAADRTKTPVNLFTHIIKDMERNTDLADMRGGAKITAFSEVRWIMEYLPSPQVEFNNPSLDRGSRKFYLPKLKAEIERVGYIPLTWIMTILLDNDYPVRALTGLAETLTEKNPALARVVTREQFEYALTLVAKTLIDRAKRSAHSWDEKWSTNHIGTSFFHHAVYMGHQYVQTLKNYSDAKARFMDSLKDDLKALLADTETLTLLQNWYLNQNPWSHGKTPEDAYAHYLEELAFNDRREAHAAAERGPDLLGTDHARGSVLPLTGLPSEASA